MSDVFIYRGGQFACECEVISFFQIRDHEDTVVHGPETRDLVTSDLEQAMTWPSWSFGNLDVAIPLESSSLVTRRETRRPRYLNNDMREPVTLNFWTSGCYNCRNTLPSIRNWDARYRDKGLTIIGVHTPEFEREKNIDNLRREITELGIRYPVVTDNDNAMWNAYNVQAWPTWFGSINRAACAGSI